MQTDIGEGTFDYSFDDARIAKESATDGVFVIRTSLPRTDRSSAQVVLTEPAHSFRTLLNSLSGIVRNTCQPKGGEEQGHRTEISMVSVT